MHSQTRADATHPNPGSAENPRRWRALALLSVAQFMLILDITVVAIALPDIGADLRLDRATLTWVVTAYTLLFGGLMLFGGRATDLFGARRMVMAGLATFTVASLITGLAGDGPTLIAGRVAQGIGAALLSPAALSIVTTTFHGAERHRALGVWAALGGTGSAAGVLLGGLLTAGPGWEWVFFVNLPVGLAVLAALPGAVPASRRSALRAGIDVPGAVLVTTATGAAIYGLINAGDHGWGAARTLLPLATAAVLYTGFVLLERNLRAPLMDVRILARRPVFAGGFLMVVATGLLVGGFFLGSFFLQHVQGRSALTTGLLFLPIAIGTIIGAHTGSRAIGHLGGRSLAAGALLVTAAGIAAPAIWSGAAALVAGISVAALGLGATFVAATTTALGHVSPHEAGVTSGIINTFHEFGAALGVAVISSLAAASLAATAAGTEGFTRAFGASAAAAVAAAVAVLFVVPAGRPPAGVMPHAH